MQRKAIILTTCTLGFITVISVCDYFTWLHSNKKKHLSPRVDRGPINYTPIYLMYFVITVFNIQYALASFHIGERFVRMNQIIERFLKSYKISNYFKKDLGLGNYICNINFNARFWKWCKSEFFSRLNIKVTKFWNRTNSFFLYIVWLHWYLKFFPFQMSSNEVNLLFECIWPRMFLRLRIAKFKQI